MTTKFYDDIDVSTIIDECLAESLQGWHKELWYHKDKKKFSFSGWMTQNSWNESNDDNDIYVTNFNAIHLTDNDEIASLKVDETGYFDTDIDTEGLDKGTIENCKNFYTCYDGNEEVSENFPLKAKKEKILLDLKQYSILNENEAIEALVNIAENEGWFDEDFEAIEQLKNDIEDEV
jgi:hypothetical protein